MKKLIIIILLTFALYGCQNMGDVLNDNLNSELEGYVMVKSTMYNNIYIVYFDEDSYVWHDETYGELSEFGLYYLYQRIDIVPFYTLINRNQVMLYGTGRNAAEIFVKASDIHRIKIEV